MVTRSTIIARMTIFDNNVSKYWKLGWFFFVIFWRWWQFPWAMNMMFYICVARACLFLLLVIILSVPWLAHSMFEKVWASTTKCLTNFWHQQMTVVKDCRVWSWKWRRNFCSDHHHHYFRPQASFRVLKPWLLPLIFVLHCM